MTFRLAFTVPIVGRGKGRPNFSRRGPFVKTYTDAKTRAYEEQIKAAAIVAMAGRPPFSGPVVLTVRVRRPFLTSATKKVRAMMLSDRIRPTSKPDWDNYGKSVSDALNGVAYLDDAQVVDGRAIKVYAAEPGVDIVVREWAPAPTEDA